MKSTNVQLKNSGFAFDDDIILYINYNENKRGSKKEQAKMTNGKKLLKIAVINGTEQQGCTFQMKGLFLDTMGRDNTITEYTLPKDCPVFCTGCKACFYNDISVCPHKEYTVPIWNSILDADLLVFTSPVYVFHVTAQMKALLDHFGSKWMAHSPDRLMFSKQVVVITNAIGMGMRNVLKDIDDSLKYWGVARIYPLKIALGAAIWNDVSPKKKAAIKRQCVRICEIVKSRQKVKPSIGTKARFYIMRLAQTMINKSELKAGRGETKDYRHWKSNGWIDGKKPWLQEGL